MKDTAKQTFLSALRHVFTALGGIAIAHGYATQSQLTELAGALPLLLGAIWGPLDEYLSARRAEDEARMQMLIASAVTAALAKQVLATPSAIISEPKIQS